QALTVTPAVSATFTNGGPVSEGSTAKVTFSSVTGGSGGYKYSYDFGNDGTFEVVNSTSATATVPATYLDDGPGTRVVHGRVRDSRGEFADFTTTVPINNVAPMPSISGP